MATRVIIHHAKIRHLLGQTQSELKKSLQKAMLPGGVIHDQTPVDTGELRRRVDQRVSGSSGDLLVQAFWQAEYAEILEFSNYNPREPGTKIPWAVDGVLKWATSPEFSGAVGRGLDESR